MKTLNLVFCILFGILSLCCLITAIVLHRPASYCLAFILGSVSYVAYTDYKHPENLEIMNMKKSKWTKKQIIQWLIDVDILLDSCMEEERKDGKEQLRFLIQNLKKQWKINHH